MYWVSFLLMFSTSLLLMTVNITLNTIHLNVSFFTIFWSSGFYLLLCLLICLNGMLFINLLLYLSETILALPGVALVGGSQSWCSAPRPLSLKMGIYALSEVHTHTRTHAYAHTHTHTLSQRMGVYTLLEVHTNTCTCAHVQGILMKG